MSEPPSARSIFVEAFLKMTPIKRVVFLIVGFGLAYAALANLYIAIAHGEITVPASGGIIIGAAADAVRFQISVAAWIVLLTLGLLVAMVAMLGDRLGPLLRAWRASRNIDK